LTRIELINSKARLSIGVASANEGMLLPADADIELKATEVWNLWRTGLDEETIEFPELTSRAKGSACVDCARAH